MINLMYSGDILVNQPLISVDRQMGLVIVAPEGKPAETVFTRMSYDEERDQSVVHCESTWTSSCRPD